MKTKTRIATLSSKRFSRRIRIREKNEIAKNTPESIDIRKSADQFQQNEFLKLFDLESTCSSTDQSQGQQTNASYLNNSTNSLSLNKDCRGFPLTPVVVRKRSRSGNLKAFDQNKYDDMSTHLSKQILVTSTMSFGKHCSAAAQLIGNNRISYNIFCIHFHCR